jgi:hypothetical protein
MVLQEGDVHPPSASRWAADSLTHHRFSDLISPSDQTTVWRQFRFFEEIFKTQKLHSPGRISASFLCCLPTVRDNDEDGIDWKLRRRTF